MPPVSPSPATEPRRFTRLRHKPADADPDADTKLEHGATELRRFTRLRSKPANADADLDRDRDRDPDADADADADAASSAPMPSVNPSPATEPRRFTRLRYKQADADPDADTKLERGGTELMCFTRLRSKPGNANPDAELLRGASLSKRKSAAKARRTRGSAAKGDAGGAINDCIFAEEPDAEEMGEEGEEERATKKMVPRLSTNRRADASQDNFVGNPLPHGEARQPWIHWYTVKVVVIIEKLAVLYESRQQWSRAVQMLSGIDLHSGIRMLDDTSKLSKCVQIARLYLEDGDAVNAEAFINKSPFLVTNSSSEVLNLPYRVCSARILDLKRKFLEAALRYYGISQIEQRQIGDEEIDENAFEQALSAAITCTILAGASPQRSWVLATLYKDERCSKLKIYPILQKVFLEIILRKPEIDAFAEELKAHQVVVIIEKLAVLYESRQQWSRAVQMLSGIDLHSGIRMLDDTNKLSKCVQIARLYLEVEALTHFEDDIEGLQQWDQQDERCSKLKIYPILQKVFPEIILRKPEIDAFAEKLKPHQVVVIIEKIAVLYESRQQWSRAVQMLGGIDLDSGIRMLDDTNKLSKCVQIARLYLEVEALIHFEDDIEGLQQWDQQGDNKIGNYEDGETGSVEREAKKTQLFINLFGYRTIPIRENLSEVTVKQLVEFALKKEGFTLSDFYSTIPGKVLEPESLLSLYDIPRDGTITVTTRLRGGTVYHHLIELKPWNEVIAAIVRFEVVQLPQGLIGTVRNRTEGLNLSPDMQHYSIEALRELTRKHYIGICYGGDFTGEQILFENGQARFANSVEPQEYTHILARLDYRKMFEIFSHAFWAGPPMQYPLHVSDLLNFLLHPPENARPNSLGVIAYLSNHVSLLPYMLRVSASKILRCLIDGLDFVEFMTLPMLFRLIDWHALIRDVPAMNTILLYNPDPNAPGNVPMYGFQASECVRHSSNYYKHADHVQFTMKQLEAALALATDSVSFLPRMLQDLAIRVDGVQPNSPGLQRFLSSVLDLLGNRTIVGLNPEA